MNFAVKALALILYVFMITYIVCKEFIEMTITEWTLHKK